MPSVKRTGVKSAEVKTGFESYDGPEPTKRGMYRARISILQYKRFRKNPDTGNQSEGFKIQVILEAQKGDPKGHKQYDGYPQFSNIVFGDKEAMLSRENNFYAALGLKDEPTIVFADGELEDGVDIKTLGGKALAAIKKLYVNVDLKPRRDGQDGMEIDGIYRLKEVAGTARGKAKTEEAEEPEEDDADLMEEEGEEEETDESRAEELAAAGIPDLRALAKEYGIVTAGKKKDALIEAILEYESDLPEEEEEEPEDDEEEEEAEEDDERNARSEELSELDRAALKKIIKGLQPDFKVFASTSDDDLRAAILTEEFGEADETPF